MGRARRHNGQGRVQKTCVIISVPLLLALAGCGGGSTQPPATSAAAGPTDTAATTSTAATTTTAAGASTQRYVSDDGEGSADVTVFRYRGEVTLPEFRESGSTRYAAIEVRVCVKKAPEGMASLSWEPWSLTDAEARTYQPAGSYSPDTLVGPLYPNEKATPVGTCRRGWVPFELTLDARPTTVEYNTGVGNILTWPIKA